MKSPKQTRSENLEEIVKCGRDPIYFINSYVYIQHPTRGRIRFETYDFQDDVVRQMREHRFNIVMKSRQLGLSTVSAAYALWLALFYRDKNILVIATKLGTAMNFIKKIKAALKSLPEWLVMPTYSANAQSVTFSNGSQIVAIPTSEDAGRSEALSLLICDEAAYIRNFADLYAGLYPTVSTGGSILLLSTPAGVGGEFYRLWVEAEAGINDFNPIKLPWYLHPEHDDAWFAKETRNMAKRKIAAEFLCEFEASGDTFLQADAMENILEMIEAPVEKLGPGQNVWVWKAPVHGHKYVMTADVARGDAADYSTFHIIDVDECDVVVEYMGKMPPERLANLMDEWGRKYNSALACPENNSFGFFTAVSLRDGVPDGMNARTGYPRMWYSHRRGSQFEYNTPDYTKLPGFSTQGHSREQILTKLEELLRNKQLKSHSQRLFDQLQTFVWVGKKAEAMKGSHDDLVISLAIGAWLVDGATSVSATSANTMAIACLNASSINRAQGLPGGIEQVQPLGAQKYAGQVPVFRPRESSQVKQFDPAYRGLDDVSWLYK